ncbi:MAG: mycothiol synthase [Actinobacteria bacterium]|nr:mycothiol synthase [Actinomycetota bacterium]
MNPADFDLTIARRLAGEEVPAVNALIQKVTDADGVRPLSEHVMLHLRYGGDSDVIQAMAWTKSGQLVGYAHLDVTDSVEGSSVEMCVDPQARGLGIATALVAMALATNMGFTRMRSLVQMPRSLVAPLPEPELPSNIAVRTFVPGQDEAQWLTVNKAAFANHPEQGAWDLTALTTRMNESWFDPEGFFVALNDANRMVGFHWTKVHGGLISHEHNGEAQHAHHSHGHDPIGEIYVIGVLPNIARHGLGRALALIGLRYLRSLGLPEAMLYVEADNHSAHKLYESLGFTHWDTDVMFRAPDLSGTIEA